MQRRSDFLALGALAAVAAPAAARAAVATPRPSASPQPSATPQPIPPLQFDRTAFDAALDVPAPHRHLFAAVTLDGGEVFGAMRNTLNAYSDIGTPLRDVHPVAVLYHGLAVLLGFDDSMWNQYFIPLRAALAEIDGAVAKDFASVYDGKKRGNPSLHKTGGRDDASIETLAAEANARFFLCNNATQGFSRFIATHLKKSSVAVYTDLAAHLVPNASLVPAGVWAVHAVQEHKYTLLQATIQN